MYRFVRLVLLSKILILSVYAYAEKIEAVSHDKAKPWTSVFALDDPTDFHFAIITDRTGQHRAGVFSSAMDKLNLLAPAFVVSVGDFIEGYTENEDRLNQEWNEIERYVRKLDPPFFYAPGNHDMSNAVMAEHWQQRFGPSFYHFVYKDVLFLILNSELFGMVEDPDTPVPGPWKQADQMDFVRQTLAHGKDARWTIVLIHQPLWDPSPSREINEDWLAVERLLGTRKYTVFAGHYHRYTKAVRHDRNYITLATTGGGSALRGPLWGEFDHVSLVNMSDAGPKIANLVLDGILDENVSTLASRELLQALQEAIVAKPTVDIGEMFVATDFRVEITNPMPSVLTVTPRLRARSNFDVGSLRSVSVAPGETQTVTLKLSSSEAQPYRQLKTAAVDWTVTATGPAGQILQTSVAMPVLPLTTHPVPRVDRAYSVDGHLSDWQVLPYEVSVQGDVASPPISAGDISFRFGVAHDEAFMYIGVEVKDDKVVADPAFLARLQDAVAISVDTRPEAERNRNMPVVPAIIEGFYGGSVVQILAPKGASEDTFLSVLKRLEDKVTSAAVITPSGYNVELAIPFALLDERAGGSWRHARIGVRVYDLDSDSGAVDVLHWQPYRYGNAPLAGSHAFIRMD